MKMREERPARTRSRRQTTNNQHPTGETTRTSVPAPVEEAGQLFMPDVQPAMAIRNSLYDLIPLGMREKKLINTAAFLRLQQVKQLGFVYRIWPGATHSRYEHSLGCYHLAVRAV